MVACVVAPPSVALQSGILIKPPMSASVDLLKQQLLQAVENGQQDAARAVLGDLEKIQITKEILETTRVGAAVNEIRKKIAENWPELSKQCRQLIKLWQKMVEVHLVPSGASSANVTPNMASPGAAKLARRSGLTPCTPINRRITSTGLTNGSGRSTTVSPACGSYAPKELISPNFNGGMHKSQSVGTDLLARGDENKNGKRRHPESMSSPNPQTLKRTKTAVGSLSSQNVSSVSAARQAVQSTTELVAQLSQNLPEHMSMTMSMSIKEHEEKVKREQMDEELAISMHSSLSPYVQPERKKRKYERRSKVEAEVEPEERRGDLILRLPRLSAVKEEAEVPIKSEAVERIDNPEPVVPTSKTPTTVPSASRPNDEPQASSPPRKQIDWMAMLPSLEELRISASKTKPNETLDDPHRLYLKRVKQREVLILPYLNVQTVPDHIRYRYPNPERFMVEPQYRRKELDLDLE